MVDCRYTTGRRVPISLNNSDNMNFINAERFNIILIKSGHLQCVINGIQCFVNSRTVLCLSKFTRYEFLNSYGLDAVSLSFSPEFINVNLNLEVIEDYSYEKLCQKHHYPRFELFMDINSSYLGIISLYEDLLLHISDYLEKIQTQLLEQPDPSWSCRTRSYVFKMMSSLELLRKEYINDESPDDLPLRVCNYIMTHLNSDLSVDLLCKQFATNHTTLFNKFKNYTGFPVSLYIIQKRLECAKRDLAFTCLTLTEIAKENGFNKSAYFTRIFKQNVGMAPSQYRRDMRNSRPNKITH